MPEPEPSRGNVKLFGMAVPAEKERRFILIASAIGVGFVLWSVLKARASGAVAASSSSPGTGANQATGSASSPGATGGAGVSTPLPTVEFRFSESTSPTVVGSGSGGGGGGLSIFGLGSIGGSSSHSSQNGLMVSNTFSADTIVSNADAGTIASIEAWLTGLAGTQEQRANQAQTEINQYQTAVLGHKTPASPVPGTVG
jgi:hypothetical protein